MRWKPLSFAVDIRRELEASKLAQVSDEELAVAENEGFLAGNRSYQDLRGFNWKDVESALPLERAIIARLKTAPDLEAAAGEFDEIRGKAFDEREALWDLDVGVAAAVIALSALGATPVSSCNGGAFGGHHVAACPYVAFFLPKSLAEEVLRCAEIADVGVKCDASGIAQIFTNDADGLVYFAEVIAIRNRFDMRG